MEVAKTERDKYQTQLCLQSQMPGGGRKTFGVKIAPFRDYSFKN